MEPVGLIVAGLVVCGAIALGSWYFSADQRALRAMRKVPYRAIADATGGEKVRVSGTVAVLRTVVAPLTGRPCAYWRIVIDQQRRTGNNRTHWETIIAEQDGVDFLVEDDTGKALVDTRSLVTAVLEKDGKLSSGMFNAATLELEAFLQSRGHSSKGWLFNKGMRYREGIVEAGETVTVVGRARWERDPDASARPGRGYRDAELPKRLVLESPDDGPLLITDESD